MGTRPSRGPSSSSSKTGGALGRLTLLAAVQGFALVVFMLGFFLTRQEVPHHSHCQVGCVACVHVHRVPTNIRVDTIHH